MYGTAPPVVLQPQQEIQTRMKENKVIVKIRNDSTTFKQSNTRNTDLTKCMVIGKPSDHDTRYWYITVVFTHWQEDNCHLLYICTTALFYIEDNYL